MARLLASHLFWQTLASYWDRFFGLLLSVILARLIDPAIFGVFAVGTAIAQMASLPTRWDLGAFPRTDAYYRGKGFGAVWRLTKKLFRFELLIVGTVALVLYLIGKPSNVIVVVLVSGLVTSLDKFLLVMRGDLEGKGKFRQNFTSKVLHTTSCFAVGIPLALMGYGLAALTVMLVLGLMVTWWVVRRASDRDLNAVAADDVEVAAELRKKGLWAWMNQIGNVAFLRGDKIMLSGVESMKSIGFYVRGFSFSPISFMVLGSMCSESAIVAISKIEDHKKRLAYVRKRLFLLVAAGLVNAVVWLLFAEEIIGFVFGEKWLPAVPYFKLFAGLALAQSFYGIANALMYGSKHFRAMAIVKLVSISVGATGIILWGINYASVAVGLQLTMCIAALGMVLVFVFEAKKGRGIAITR